MNRFYVEQNQIGDQNIIITGSDVNHIKNVLRKKIGDEIVVCNGQGMDYTCTIDSIENSEVHVKIDQQAATDTELPSKLYLFQGLPKKDKMELIVQKAVELGVYQIIPVMMKRTIVKLEDKKKELKKIDRWQTIATNAAKQSNRGMIPEVKEVMTFKEAMEFAKTLEYSIMPYENEKDLLTSKEAIKMSHGKSSIGIFIGPEGGFDPMEVDLATETGIVPISLGRRILRTETAGLAVVSILMFELENK